MKDDGGPAFPRNQASGNPHEPGGEVWLMQRGMVTEGMSLRDWFAGQALQGMYAREGQVHAAAAVKAYAAADHMLIERAKRRQS